jgi:DNA-binding NtrC family response regulator
MARILIGEDDEAQRFLYHEELVEEGYEVVLAKNGVEALKCLEESSFDLIVLDVRMPIMNGIEFLGKISGRFGEIPVIIHTAYPEYRNQFISFMVDAFVLKSADLSPLKSTVRGLLEKKKQRKENEHGRREANDC